MTRSLDPVPTPRGFAGFDGMLQPSPAVTL
jgi:hypothetical protein